MSMAGGPSARSARYLDPDDSVLCESDQGSFELFCGLRSRQRDSVCAGTRISGIRRIALGEVPQRWPQRVCGGAVAVLRPVL